MFAVRASLRLLARSSGLTLQPARVACRPERQLGLGCHAFNRAAGSEPAAGRRGGVRPSKTLAKQEAKTFLDISRQLARLTDKQLARLEPLVGEEVVTAVALASSISHRNQGRQRQEGLVARLLRESVVEDSEMAQLKAALESVKTGQGVIANPAVDRQMELWLDALLAADEEAMTEVFGLAQAQGGDLQQLRQLLRQAQQTEPVPAAAPSSDDDEPAAAAEAPQEGSAAVNGSRGAAPVRLTAKARAARREMRKLLQPLAEAQLAVGEEEDV